MNITVMTLLPWFVIILAGSNPESGFSLGLLSALEENNSTHLFAI
jgi:hypothetical protein